jgi:hypothetical protein
MSDKNEVMKAQDDTTIDGAFRIATAMSKTDMVPKHFQNKPTDCFLALNIAKRLNIDPFAVLSNLYVVHGTPAFSAKFLIAMANKSGTFSTPIMFRWEGEGDSLKATAYAKHASSGEEVSYEFSMADAKAEGYTKNPKYKSMGRLMLAYRAATLFTRLYCPETAMGAVTVEEVEDMRAAKAEVSPAPYADADDIIPDVVEPIPEPVEDAGAERVNNGELL